MAQAPTPKPDENTGRDYKQDGSQPGVLGDQTEEQNLGQKGDPSKRITKEEVEEAFKDADRKS
ncbi:MAG: hypothetical protein INR64_09355 [Caulobacteraceae bacterium]|nr:hypothetical protein [Caulobacter sp.]